MNQAADKKSILLVEDDVQLVEGLRMHIEDLGYSLDHAADGKLGVKKALEKQYALIILDINLPDVSGYEVLKTLRVSKVQTPILILSGLAGIDDKVKSRWRAPRLRSTVWLPGSIND